MESYDNSYKNNNPFRRCPPDLPGDPCVKQKPPQAHPKFHSKLHPFPCSSQKLQVSNSTTAAPP